MGTKNRERRRQKAKRLAERERRSRAGGPPPRQREWSRDRPIAPAEVRAALWSLSGVRIEGGPDPASAMRVLRGVDKELLGREAEAILGQLIDLAWAHGWQPAELARHGRRQHAAIGRIVATAIAADHAKRDRRALHPDWIVQADSHRLGDLPQQRWLAATVFGGEASYDTGEIWLIVDAIKTCVRLSPLPILIPPPGSDPATWQQRGADAGPVDDPVLAKVRALLDKAESTTFRAEAEAFTAKAQELMARHAIDAARLWDSADRSEAPITIRVAIDDPYADAKAMLLQVVATNGRCRTVIHGDYGLNSLIGFAADVAYADLLYTSLLVQAQAALQAEAATAPPGSHIRSRAFRSSFLNAYAARIDDRLAAVNDHVANTVESHDDALLPVLVARADRVDAAVDEQFPHLESRSFRGPRDALGFARGRQAADRAELNPAVASSGRATASGPKASAPAVPPVHHESGSMVEWPGGDEHQE